MEEWKSVWIDDEEWPYEVSDKGQVRRMKGTEFGRPPRGDNLSIHSDGRYSLSQLSKNGVVKTIRIHRLVLEAFLGPSPVGYETNHRDGNKSNNSIENLEWVTPLENRKHATLNGLSRSYVSSEEGRRRHRIYRLTETDTEAAAILNLSVTAFGAWRTSVGLLPKHPATKLSMKEVRAIRRRFRRGERQVKLAREFDVTQPTISLIVRGRTRRE